MRLFPVLLIAAAPAPVHAQTIYDYNGNPLTGTVTTYSPASRGRSRSAPRSSQTSRARWCPSRGACRTNPSLYLGDPSPTCGTIV